MYVLDTDLLSLLERSNVESISLQMRLDQIPAEQISTTIVTYEEQMRGWLARAAQADTADRLVTSYARLLKHIDTFRDIPILPFNDQAGAIYAQLRKAGIRIGAMDLKIAAIALANNATVLTRNLTDFNRIPELKAEDWSI